MVATVSAVGEGQDVEAGHGPYIRAVCDCIEAREIRVAEVDIETSDCHGRTAWLMLRPDLDTFAERMPAEAHLLWDERHGWSLRPQLELPGNLISKGLDVLPEPEDVAAWVVVGLAHPELTPSYEDGRAYRRPDPEFEARLARYAAMP